MRPTVGAKKVDKWLKQENLMKLQDWKMHDGLTDDQIAAKIGVAPKTIYQWKKKYPSSIGKALKVGREIAIAQIKNKLFEKARSGNMTAVIFYLKNYDRDNFNDSRLSLEEREQVKASTRKTLADARLLEAKAKLAEQLNDNSDERLDKILDKIVSEAGEDNDVKKPNDRETDTGSQELSE